MEVAGAVDDEDFEDARAFCNVLIKAFDRSDSSEATLGGVLDPSDIVWRSKIAKDVGIVNVGVGISVDS